MRFIVKFIVVTGFGLTMAGCSTLSALTSFKSGMAEKPKTRLCATEKGQFYECQDLLLADKKLIQGEPDAFNPKRHFISLNEYTQQMAMDLHTDLLSKELKGAIAVASFVIRDESLRTTNRLGNELAEYFINDLTNLGLPISDFNVTGTVEIEPSGSYAFAKMNNNVLWNTDIAYVLTGSMMQTTSGIMVSARIIDLNTQQVLASSAKLFPPMLINSLQ